MWLMLQHDRAEDFVIGTGVSHSVREFCEAAFGAAGLDWRKHVVSDPTLYRPTDSAARTADATRARARLGWTPEVDFESLVQLMVRADLERTTEEGSA
jgi:GDPmannose 4,6-dehydratase